MNRLIGVEFRRAVHRRMVWVLVGLVALFGLAAAAIFLASTDPNTPEERQIAYEEAHAEWETGHVEQEAQCRAEGLPESECVLPEPTLDDGHSYGLADLDDVLEEVPVFVTFLASAAAFLAGASLIGAEHTSGNLQSWLTFVPARTRVFFSKLLPPVAVGLLLFAAATVTVIGGITLAWLIETGSAAGFSAALPGLVRGALVVVFASLCGFALASLGRHTGVALAVAALALPFSYLLAVFSDLTQNALLPRWTPVNNLIALVTGEFQYSEYPDNEWKYQVVTHTISGVQGGIYWAVLTLLGVALAWAVFRRRDLT